MFREKLSPLAQAKKRLHAAQAKSKGKHKAGLSSKICIHVHYMNSDSREDNFISNPEDKEAAAAQAEAALLLASHMWHLVLEAPMI